MSMGTESYSTSQSAAQMPPNSSVGGPRLSNEDVDAIAQRLTQLFAQSQVKDGSNGVPAGTVRPASHTVRPPNMVDYVSAAAQVAIGAAAGSSLSTGAAVLLGLAPAGLALGDAALAPAGRQTDYAVKGAVAAGAVGGLGILLARLIR